MKKILFVSHDASRTGAPMVLLHLLRWLSANTRYEIHILLLANGPMMEEFQKLYTTYLWEKDWKISFAEKIKGRFLKRKMHTINQYQILAELKKINFDLIYLNTVVSNHILPELLPILTCPVVCHVHENEYTINFFYPKALDHNLSKHITHFIAVSESTKKSLMEVASVPAEKISICYEFVPTSQFSKPSVDGSEMKSRLGISDQFIVGGSGLPMWRKGIDLFLQLAFETREIKSDHDIKFIWVGPIDHSLKCTYDYEKRRLGIDDNVILTGQVSDPNNYFQLFDIFTLTSREDPFPLVCLEAASLGKPILCFGESGGMEEFLKEEPKLVIPYGNVKAMVQRILELMESERDREHSGQRLKEKVKEYDVEVGARKIAILLEDLIRRDDRLTVPANPVKSSIHQ